MYDRLTGCIAEVRQLYMEADRINRGSVVMV
jgi:hypothetical protein